MSDEDRKRVVMLRSEPLQREDKKLLQELIGCLLFLVYGTRPDLAYAVIRLSQFSSRPEKHHC